MGKVSETRLDIPEMVRKFSGVPLVTCTSRRQVATGQQGDPEEATVCCQDPLYTDPWPR